MRAKLLPIIVAVVTGLVAVGCDSSTYYNTTIEGTALPSFETGTAVTLFMKADAAGAGQKAVLTGRVAGQSQGWLILDTESERQVIAASAIARLELPKPTSGSKPPAATPPATPQASPATDTP